MRVAVAFSVLATLALAYGAPHGIAPHHIEFVDQAVTAEHVNPIYGYHVRTAHEHPIAFSEGFGYKLKAAVPVHVHGGEYAEVEGHSVGSGGFNYAFGTVETPVAVGGVLASPVTFTSRKISEKVEGVSGAAHTVRFDAEPYLHVAPGPVSVTYERTGHHAGSKAQGEGSFSYSYHADSPVFSGVPAGVVPASVAVVKSGEGSEKSGSFAYSVNADAPLVAPATYVAAAPVGVALGHSVVGYGDKISADKNSGSFSYAYQAEAPAVVAPVVHHSAIAAPVHTASFVKTVDHAEDVGSHGAFSYSVTADAPVVGYSHAIATGAVVDASQSVDTKSVDDKSSGSFSYSFGAEAPIGGAVVAPVVASPVQTAYTTSVVNDEAVIGNRGSFSYSVTADAPVVAPVSYVAAAPVGVAYEHSVVESTDKVSDDKSSGAFAYSYKVDAPAVFAPVVHHSVVAAPAYTESIVKTVENVDNAGSRGAFSYSVTADAPLVGYSPAIATGAIVESTQSVDTKSVDAQVDDKSSGSFSYSFSAEAPVGGAVVSPVVAAPFATGYTTSVLNDETAIRNRGSFAYSVTADAPVVAPVSYFATAPAGVEYEQTVGQYGGKISDDKSSGAFSYSYHVDAPAVVAPVFHHSVVAPVDTESIVKTVDSSEYVGSQGDASLEGVAQDISTGSAVESNVDTKTVDTLAEDKSSGSFSNSISAEAPIGGAVVAPVVASPVQTAYTTSVVNDEAVIGNRGSFSYYVTADAPVVAPVSYVAAAPVGVAYEHSVVESTDKVSDDKSSGAFAYSYKVDAPAVVAPVVHHSVVAAPAYTESIVKTVENVDNAGSRGAFSYSVTADAPLVGYSPAIATGAIVESAQSVDTKSVDAQVDDKSSGSFSYSFSAEAPVGGAVVSPVVAAPFATGYTTSVLNDETAIRNRGSFAYSVTADAPIVSPVSYVATAPAGVGYEQTVADDKSSGSFSYSFNAEAPVGGAVVAPVVAAPVHTAYTTSVLNDETAIRNRGSFSYSVNADAPVVAPVSYVGNVPTGVEYEQTVFQYGDKVSDDKAAGAFGYTYHVDAPAVVAAPVHTAYTTSVLNDETAIRNRGSFSYSVNADAPVVAPVSYVGNVPAGVEYEQTVFQYGDKVSDDKAAGAFGYTYHVDAPAVVAPIVHHSVAAPLHTGSFVKTVEYSNFGSQEGAQDISSGSAVESRADASAEGKSSGSFSYSISAEAPVAAVGAPVYHSSSVVGAVPVGLRSSLVRTEYIDSVGAVPIGVTADDLKLHSIGNFERVYGVRTAPVNTVVTGYEHTPIGYGVPITIKCD